MEFVGLVLGLFAVAFAVVAGPLCLRDGADD